MNALVPRATIRDICGHRDRALGLYEAAHQALVSARLAMTQAHEAAHIAAPSARAGSWSAGTEAERKCFLAGFLVPDADEFVSTARRLLDIGVWSHLIGVTDLESLMDKTAKDQLRQALLRDPPEATEENICATLQSFVADADMIFRRGVATCFSNLDRRFRSHDGWKIGARIILTRCFNEHGSWNYYRNERDTLRDIERAFHVLDGKPYPSDYAGIVGAIDATRGKKWHPHQSVTESDFFRVRIFENGNAHVWFKCDDLLAKVNQILGEYYGESIPEERGPDADTGLNDPKTALAKNFGFYPTTGGLVDEVIEAAALWQPADRPKLTVLEPSAGTGNLAAAAAARGTIVDCVEIQASLAADLRRQGKYRRVTACDFLMLQADPACLYQRVAMNPPFNRGAEIDHVLHALKFLAPTGILVAILPAGIEYRTDRKTTAFRDLMRTMKANWRDLPPGSFSSVGTNINVRLLTVRADGYEHYR